MKFIENSETQQRLKAKILFLTRYTQERNLATSLGSMAVNIGEGNFHFALRGQKQVSRPSAHGGDARASQRLAGDTTCIT